MGATREKRRPPAECCNYPRLEQRQSFSRSAARPLGTRQGVRVTSPRDLEQMFQLIVCLFVFMKRTFGND
jgi:hypothetical protein